MSTKYWLITVLLFTMATVKAMAQDGQDLEMSRSGYATSDGLQIYFEQSGIGRPMILVHGWGSDTQHNWVDTGWVSLLGKHRSVISIDVRGHGKSDKPYALTPYSYAAMSGDVIAVMNALNIDTADFLGYSMGSFMGAHLLGHQPQRFTSMILGGIGDETDLSAAQGASIAQALRASNLADISSATGRGVRKFVAANPNNDLTALAFSALKMWPEGYPLDIAGPNISSVQFPVLIINGENDLPYVNSADALAAALPNGKHIRIANANHLTTVTDDYFKKTVVDFLLSL